MTSPHVENFQVLTGSPSSERASAISVRPPPISRLTAKVFGAQDIERSKMMRGVPYDGLDKTLRNE